MRESWTAVFEVASEDTISGKAGAYISVANGEIAQSPPRTRISRPGPVRADAETVPELIR
ncbi:hypothetical protein [Sciscionella sediminilitoris]|uniref:hypothetical protein n=1 Tax=Sciscionella sediminilitoris TaxID=1445613 RepID=UPI0004DF19EA|nr:hypothetical protein [Sciscionella sp. SE31]